MPPSRPAPGSLVLYKSKRALVAGLSDKLDIVLEDGKSKRVREKDVQLLHPGPVGSLAEVREIEGETDEAWELLQGASTDLRELAELVYGDFTPSAAWSRLRASRPRASRRAARRSAAIVERTA